ncbi:molybdate ABC transporter permease subunit [Desulfospira joergensenii]|uniref:molybdate ABC transporter permease subunit n=1 Tax=Desulfospira joergensenii TaxID=53329 RepID=UPI0003B56FE0|nr:molybdate ABC transporter permease subunit [Desulfospira joergensenii]
MQGLTPMEWEAIGLSLKVSGLAVAVSLPAGIAAAWILSRCRFPGKGLLDGIIHLPLVLPPVVTGYLLLVCLGKNGIVGHFLFQYLGITLAFTWKGAAVAAAVMAFPLLVRAVRLSADAVDPGMEQAARTLGAGRVRVFFTVTLPLMVPGIITGVILAFARSLGEFGATITFVSNIQGETQTLPLALYSLTQVPNGEAGALRLCIISVVLAMTALVFSEWLAKRFAAFMKG